MRPEQGLIALRRALDVYANLRPASRPGTDLLIVRELVGGLYYGASGRLPDGSAYDTCHYTPEAIERVARRAFELAGARRAHLTSVDKVNVLETSRLWRETVTRVAADYPDIELQHMLVDTAGLQLVQHPERFDVLLTENTFGDILSDVAAGVCGGLGLAASASLGDGRPGHLRARPRLRPRHRRPGDRQSGGHAPLDRTAAPARSGRARAGDIARGSGRAGAGRSRRRPTTAAARRRRSSRSSCSSRWSRCSRRASGR